MSSPHLLSPSPEQRIQQLESTLMSVLTQLQDLTRDLQSSRTERADLQRRVDWLEEEQLCSSQNIETDLNDLRLRVDDLDGGPDEQQIDDSD
jgi:chromosome segregation ATPase